MACIHWHKLTKHTRRALLFFTVLGARTFLWLKFLVSIKWRCSLKTRLLKLRCSETPRLSNAWIQLRLFCILSTCVDGATSRFIQRFSTALSRYTWHALNTFNTIHKPSINDHVNKVEDNQLIPGGQICCRQNGGSWLRGEGLQTCSFFFVALMLSSFLHSNLHLFANEVTKDRSRSPRRICNQWAPCSLQLKQWWCISLSTDARLAASHILLQFLVFEMCFQFLVFEMCFQFLVFLGFLGFLVFLKLWHAVELHPPNSILAEPCWCQNDSQAGTAVPAQCAFQLAFLQLIIFHTACMCC